MSWIKRHAEPISIVLSASLADVIVLLTFLTLAILRIPEAVVFAGLASIMIPVWMGLRTRRRLNNDAPAISTARPSEFISNFKSIRLTVKVVQATALVVIAVSFASRYTLVLGFLTGFSRPLDGLGIYTGLIYFFFIELTLLCTVLGLWTPKPIYLLRATLLSQFSDNGLKGKAWLDDSIGYFNRLLASEGSILKFKRGASLEALLFASPRLFSVTRLIWALGTQNRADFVTEVSNIAQIPAGQLVDRVTLWKTVEENFPLLRNSLSLLIPAAPYLEPYLLAFMNQTFDNWATLLRVLHL